MDIDPFSMLEVSLQEGPEIEDQRSGPIASAGVMHQVENDVQIIQPPPPLQLFGPDVMTPQRAVLSNVQKLASTSKDEEKFRRRAYSSISLVLRKRLHCTICDAHIGAYLGLKDMDIEHPLLKVLACPKCTLKYHYLDFPLSIEGRDVRCRWCTNSSKEESPLRYCSYCPFAFCEMCIYRNLPLDELASNKNNWICFVCNVNDLWPSRAVLWALRVLIDTNLALKEEKKWSTDQSTCCKNKSKPKRVISLPQAPSQSNGHNVAVRAAIIPNQFRVATPNNFRMVRPGPSAPTVVRTMAPTQTAYRAIRPVVQVVRPVSVPVATVATNAQSTQLYDTTWLTEKVSNISTTLLNLNNNLHRLAQGIPDRENKYSIKSKMISMVSLLNISATQLQKASKEMEEESKKILDKNYRVAKITPVTQLATTSKGLTMGKRPPPRNRSSSSRRKRYRRSDGDSDDDDDPDFRTKAKLDDGTENDLEVVVEEDETSMSSTQSYETRPCFVKLERLDPKYLTESVSDDESVKSESGLQQDSPSSEAVRTDDLLQVDADRGGEERIRDENEAKDSPGKAADSGELGGDGSTEIETDSSSKYAESASAEGNSDPGVTTSDNITNATVTDSTTNPTDDTAAQATTEEATVVASPDHTASPETTTTLNAVTSEQIEAASTASPDQTTSPETNTILTTETSQQVEDAIAASPDHTTSPETNTTLNTETSQQVEDAIAATPDHTTSPETNTTLTTETSQQIEDAIAATPDHTTSPETNTTLTTETSQQIEDAIAATPDHTTSPETNTTLTTETSQQIEDAIAASPDHTTSPETNVTLNTKISQQVEDAIAALATCGDDTAEVTQSDNRTHDEYQDDDDFNVQNKLNKDDSSTDTSSTLDTSSRSDSTETS